jgi:UDP-2,3-diacylglucosamine pyrophosphatase LpxH
MKEPKKRKLDILILSDVHLGTYGCHAKELAYYLKTVKPKIVVLNGDIIDIWQFSKRYWPKSHTRVVKQFMSWMGKGVKIYYVTGNHDEMLRRFTGFKMGSFSIVNKLVLELAENKKAWIFHGDVFDITMQHSKWLAKLGAVGYDMLIIINRIANFISEKIFRKGKLSLSKKIKNSVKTAIKFVNNFEQTAAEIAISNEYDYVVCGHIHHPEMREINTEAGKTVYLNSGDWIENLTSLEYVNGQWSIYKFDEESYLHNQHTQQYEEEPELNNHQIFENLVAEFDLLK